MTAATADSVGRPIDSGGSVDLKEAVKPRVEMHVLGVESRTVLRRSGMKGARVKHMKTAAQATAKSTTTNQIFPFIKHIPDCLGNRLRICLGFV